MLGFLLGRPVSEWEGIIPPRERRKIRALELEYERLAKRIDRAYATGRFGAVEDLERRAAEVEEKLIALHDVYIEAPEGPYPELEEREPSLEEELVRTYLFPPGYWTREEQISALQAVIRTHLFRAGRDVHPTPDQALDLARDAAERWLAVRKSYRKPS
jgi:hypothetical protein